MHMAVVILLGPLHIFDRRVKIPAHVPVLLGHGLGSGY